MAITRPKLGSSTKPKSTHPRNIAMEKIINDLPKDQQKLFREDPELRKKLKELIASEGYISPKKIKELPKGRGGTEALFSLGRSKYKPKSTKLTEVVVKPKSSVNDVAPLGKGGKGGTRRIKKGDTLSAIARRNNTTVAALMKLNPKIKDKNKIRAGDTINVGNPTRAAAKAKSTKDLNKPTSIAQAKRMGKSEYWDTKTESWKAAVTAAELKKSGLSLRAYLNKMKKKKK